MSRAGVRRRRGAVRLHLAALLVRLVAPDVERGRSSLCARIACESVALRLQLLRELVHAALALRRGVAPT
eukprot:1041841-Pleurochrysis_carterae.AAC.1